MAANDVDLEVLLGWVPEAEGFRITILYNAPGDSNDDRYFGREPIRIDLEELWDEPDPDEYGRLLGAMVFADSAEVTLAKAVRASRTAPLHLRIVIDPHAPPQYQAIRWETICQPSSGLRLTTSQNIRFSRFMAPARGNLPTMLARTGRMKALVAVANPDGVANFATGAAELGPIEVEKELARARQVLGHMDVLELPSNGKRATRAAIIEALSTGIHVFYLVCHGRLSDRAGRPELLLEDDDGGTAVADGTAFANDFGSLARIPTVVVLCSCQSAGTGRIDQSAGGDGAGPEMAPTAEKLAALGPALASAGATVVIGMHGNVTMETAGKFLPEFFNQLNVDGVPARAMAAARLLVASRPDWYMPVLYSRLKRGSAWYVEGFGGDGAQLFTNLHRRINKNHCTPIIGSGIVGEDGVLPSREELADQWVTRRQMPISEVSRSDLATVAQFVRVEQKGGVSLARDEMHELLLGELKDRHGKSLPELDFDATPLHELVSAIGRHRRVASSGTDGYSRLARLNLPVYITTSWTGLLEDALDEQGRPPVVRHFDWRKSTSLQPWPYEPLGPDDEAEERRWEEAVGAGDSDGERFSAARPLVYHLSGTLKHDRTLVLTEDDYFTWLQEWMKQVDNGKGIPGYVKAPLITNSQLFLGYQFDDWEFRMMFQAIKGFQRSLRTDDDGPHVGVQLQPTTLRIDREAAQSYLESYFEVDKINVYWQTCTRFLTDLESARSLQ